MGLAGRKTKQRIPNDPRNLAWANDANKFGAAYLAKLGWDPSQGLGVSGEGRTSAISVTQKLDMLGIGADHRNAAEGMAWKQNKDFENLLKRLNAANGGGDAGEEEPMKIDGFHRAAASSALEAEVKSESVDVREDTRKVDETEEKRQKKEKKKRKKGDDEEDGERKKKRKKSKSSGEQSDSEELSKQEKKDRKKKKKRDAEEEATAPAVQTEIVAPTPVVAPTKTIMSKHPRAAFRGRHMAAKSLASKSASAIAEILGVSPIPSASTSGYPSSAPTPYPSTPFEPGPSTSSSSGSATPADEIKLQELSVSSKSVMDYFKEKLAAKSNARVFASSPSTPSSQDEELDDYAERPRIGLGASKLRNQITETVVEGEIEERRGLGGIGSGMRSSFAAMFTSATTSALDAAPELSPLAVDEAQQSDAEEPKKSNKEKKSKKGKEKAKADGAEQTEVAVAAEIVQEVADSDKAERKRRKEEKRRRKEAEAAVDSENAGEVKERKRKKDKKKGADV